MHRVRQTRNVSLPPDQDAFVDRLVAAGRYRTVSEVVRDGLRLLEEAEHRRLLEKWLHSGLDDDEAGLLPVVLRKQAKAWFQKLLDEARRTVRAGRVDDGPVAMQRLAARLRERR